MAGTPRPVTLKPAPVAEMAEIVALALPEFVRVTVCCPVLPTATLSNDTLAGLAASVELVTTPVPDRARVCGEFGALSVKDTLPAAAPAAVGTNCAVNVIACPAETVVGKVSPEIPKAVPVTVAILMTTLALPVLVNLTVCELVCPTIALVKVREAGETESPACAPLPVKEIARGELDASLMTVTAPLLAPETVGAN